MIILDKIAPVIEGYKKYFPSHWKDEKYKWEAIQHFQDNWDPEAEDFGKMLNRATDTSFTQNLLLSRNTFPQGMIVEFARIDGNAVREMFRTLYDESLDLAERVEAFMESAEDMRSRYDDGTWKNHYQNTNTISTYLWLMYPDKYYIYKYSEYRAVAEELDDSYYPKKNGYAESMVGGFKMYDEICRILNNDGELRNMLESVLTENCYRDSQLKTMTIDFGFYLSRFYKAERKEDDKDKVILDVNAWLLTWNPKNYDWENDEVTFSLDTMFDRINCGGGFYIDWRCSSTKIKCGDLVYVMKLGTEPKGIIASGYAIRDSYVKDETRIVDVLLTKALDFRTNGIIPQENLKELFPDQQWSPQGSGISIKTDAAQWLIDNWDSYQNNDKRDVEPVIIEPEKQPVFWKISHGTPQTSGISTELRKTLEDRKAVIVNQYTPPSAGQSVTQGDSFMKQIKKGDFFYLCYAGEIVLLGQFIDDKTYANPEKLDEWESDDWQERHYRLLAYSKDHNKYTGMKKIWTSNFNSTCVKVTDNGLFEELILKPYFGMALSDLYDADYHEPFTKDNFLEEVFITDTEYDKLRSLVLRKKNVILQGAPGVGKTFSAKRLAYSIMGEKDESRICMVQFHQNYSYEDFIMGYRPNDRGGFDLKHGVFYEFCEVCKKDRDPDKPYFLIIDEINRGNLSKIFGELLMLIETDKRGEENKINLVYSEEPFFVPENLFIIGMMNTADRSLAMIDYALRRRFCFFTMEPAFENSKNNGFDNYIGRIDCKLYRAVIEEIERLNNAIRSDSTLGKGFEIGHSYFIPDNTISVIDDTWVRNVVEYEIFPLLEEYWFDDEKKIDNWKKNLNNALGAKYDG